MRELGKNDYKQLDDLGIKESVLEDQLALFNEGVKPIELTAASQIKTGIRRLTEALQNKYIEKFNRQASDLKVTRFVPASGAASRMFKAFFQFLDDGVQNEEIMTFSKNSQLFPFYNEIACSEDDDLSCSIDKMINKVKLADLPKALIPFHKYKEDIRTAFEEHLVEAAMITGESETVNLHFTISNSHQAKFADILKNKLEYYSNKHNCNFEITFSYQQHSTDTIAVSSENEPERNDDGSLIFRPGGHGALLENLNNLESDLIFIKNIDNIQPDHLKPKTVRNKKLLAGFLLSIVGDIKGYLTDLESSDVNLLKIQEFVGETLCIPLSGSYGLFDEAKKREFLFNKLNRPVRVCGMVKNEGEPGGGPFLVKNINGDISSQIVESSQIDHNNNTQEAIFQESTHFNPVDIVCWTKDYQGNKFNLTNYSDPNTSFITEKSQSGKTLKVLEHPGLWNGAMANWITIFVEVPVSTFSPVKTITDLLRKDHQAS